MNRFARTLLFAAILCLVALFVLKLVVQNRATSEMDKVISQLSLFGYATYDDIDVNLWGSKISVTDLEIDPYDDQYPAIRADRWSLELEDWLLYKQALGLARPEIPNTATLTIEGLRLPVDTYAANDTIDQLNEQFRSIAEPSCGDVEFLSFRELSDMGYQYPYTVDFTLNYKFDKPQQQLKLRLLTEMSGMGSVDVDMDIHNMPRSMNQLLLIQQAYLSQVDITYRDDGYVHRINEYCAEQEQLSVEKYIQLQSERPDTSYALQWGVVPNQDIRRLYSEFLENPLSMHWRISPASGFNLNHLSLYDVSDWAKVLHLKMDINGKPVDINGFSRPTHQLDLLKQLSDPSPLDKEADIDQNPEGLAGNTEQADDLPSHYQDVSVDQLANYVGKPVRITDENGNVSLGYLKSCDQEEARITQRIPGGEYTISVQLKNISIAQVRK